ncbi:unnamed protein product [Owenia fusiformis]|uniref:NAD(P)H oxidase (H2O2-forming) n=1 Tax=Owenia fusiformis TaxID=6347 RepID=A0A8S4N350_OWEFU|nr:unnamed protein product [Owenia fusiformis]
MRSIIYLITTVLAVTTTAGHRQRFDGWYNNLAFPDWGSVKSALMTKIPTAYADFTYHMSGEDRPNAREISNAVFAGPSGLPSYINRTALFVFFGQQVSSEIVRSSEESTCPIELIKVPVPKCDSDFDPDCEGDKTLPFLRSSYDQKTGMSPNRPRRQLNHVTSWIDGSSIYGTGNVWANCLRSFKNGTLLVQTNNFYPANNDIGLPLVGYNMGSMTNEAKNPEKMWMLGSRVGHQNPALLSISILWFRYHNYLAHTIQLKQPSWSDQKVFEAARKWVIASLQNIVMYEWLPALLYEDTESYSGYQSHIPPTISSVFEAAAFRFPHTMVPPGIYIRDYKCRFRTTKHGPALRLCNTYWDSQECIQELGFDEVLMGLSSQIGEREDNILVTDLRGKLFGPKFSSRQDLGVLTIMRGRDNGLADFNTARKVFGLEPITKWEDINPYLYHTNPEPIENLRRIYNGSLDKLDIFPAGLMESGPSGPGPFFKAVIKEQFKRIRDGDRFWFENSDNNLFTDAEVAEIKAIKLKDIMVKVSNMMQDDIQDDVFFWKNGDPCQQPKQLEESDMTKCAEHKNYDYFEGNEVTYIISFAALCLFPFLCILVAYLLFRCKQHDLKKTKKVIGMTDLKAMVRESAGSISAIEWQGIDESLRNVEVRIDPVKCCLHTSTPLGTRLRTMDFTRYKEVRVWLSINNNEDILLINDPKEYDLVMQFQTKAKRREFIDQFRQHLVSHEKTLLTFGTKLLHLQNMAVTKKKRKQLLEKFFKTVFAEAFQLDYNPDEDPSNLEFEVKPKYSDILECEISKNEFAEALAVKPNCLFLDQLFSLVDKNKSGYLSFRELLHAVTLFSHGSCTDKLHMLFNMYDLDSSGTLSLEEIAKMLKSLFEMADTELSEEAVEKLIHSMLKAHGVSRRRSLRYSDFQKLLGDHMDKLWDVCLDFKGTKVCFPKKKRAKLTNTDDDLYNQVQDDTAEVGSSKDSTIKGGKTGGVPTSGGKFSRQNTYTAVQEKFSPIKARITSIKHYMENKRQHIFYCVIFYGLCFGLFAERFYTYAVEMEHRGFRTIAGLGVATTRGAAASMSFTFSFILLTMCKNLLTKLRETFLNLYVPFDSNVAFHKVIAWTALFFTLVHIFGYAFNFYHIGTQPMQFLCVFPEIVFRPDSLPKLVFWFFQNVTGMTGILLTLLCSVVYIFAHNIAREYIFNAFWLTHRLVLVIYVLIILHGSARIVQDPYFWMYFIGPAIVFVIDKLVSISREKVELTVIKAELLPSAVTYIEFKRPHNFEYKSGQWVNIACSSQGRNEYHPFTLTSAPHEDTLSIHVRSLGPWTWNLRKTYDPENLKQRAFPKLYLDGPFGAGQQDWYRYDVSVLVGGGIGVTPYASILKDFAFMSSVKSMFKIKCQKLYFIWVTASQRHYEWLIDILKQVEEVDERNTVEIHIFITQFFQHYDLRTTMLYICEEHFQKVANKSLFTGLKAKTHFGRPLFENMFQGLQEQHNKVKKFGVFSCGPPGLTKGVERACINMSKVTSKSSFEHHFENF